MTFLNDGDNLCGNILSSCYGLTHFEIFKTAKEFVSTLSPRATHSLVYSLLWRELCLQELWIPKLEGMNIRSRYNGLLDQFLMVDSLRDSA